MDHIICPTFQVSPPLMRLRNMNLSQILSACLSFLIQLVLFPFTFLLAPSKRSPACPELPIAFSPRRADTTIIQNHALVRDASRANDEPRRSFPMSRTAGGEALKPYPTLSFHSNDPPGPGCKSQCTPDRSYESAASQVDGNRSTTFKIDRFSQYPNDLTSRDGVLDISSAQQTDPGQGQGLAPETQAVEISVIIPTSYVLPSSPSITSSLSIYSTSSDAISSLPTTPSPRPSLICFNTKQWNSDPGDTVMAGLGKRRGFKGAPLRTRELSLSQRISSSLLGSKEHLPSASPCPTSPEGYEQALLREIHMRRDPFAAKAQESFYAAHILSDVISISDMYDLAVYQSHSAQTGPEAQQRLEREHKNVCPEQLTTVYDVSTCSYSVAQPHAGALPSSSLAITLTPPSLPQTPRKDSMSATINSEASVLASTETSCAQSTHIPRVATLHPSAKLTDPDTRMRDPCLAARRRESNIHPSLLPQLHSLSKSSMQDTTSEARLQALEDIIDLLNLGSGANLPMIAKINETDKPRPGSAYGNEAGLDSSISIGLTGIHEKIYAI